MENIREMKRMYPSLRIRGSVQFFDFGLINEITREEDGVLLSVLDDGYGAFGTAARLRVELARELVKSPDSNRFMAEFTYPDGRIIQCDAACKKTFAYHGCRLQYSLVTAVECQLKIIDNDRQQILMRKYCCRQMPPKDAIVSRKGYVEEVFV